jgi:hypothetical protein
VTASDISDAARLLRHALTPKERPQPGSPYRQLLDRYQTDVAFAEMTDRIADGLGLDVHQVSHLGLLISGRAEGPFAVTLDNCGLPIRKSESRLQDRRCFALVLLAVAAHAYPNGQALVDTVTPPVRAADVERFLDRRIEALAALDDELDGLDDQESQLGKAARTWQDLPEVLPGERGRLKRDCRRWYVDTTLTFLVDQGRAHREPELSDERGDAYVLNDRFRTGLADVAAALITEMSAEPTASEAEPI